MYAELCDEYYAAGLSVIPSRGKKVAVPSFGQYSFRAPSRNEINFFKGRFPRGNIGLMLGRFNNMMAIDIDTDKKDVIDMIESVLPETPVEKRGKKGKTMFYRTSLDHNVMHVSKENGCMLEYLCSSKYTIIPPSVHPETKKEYVWLKGTLLDELDNIPELSKNSLKEINTYMNNKYKTKDLSDLIDHRRFHENT